MIMWENLSPPSPETILYVRLQNLKENNCTHQLHYCNSRRKCIRRTRCRKLLQILPITSAYTTKPYGSTAQQHHPVHRSQRILHRHESYRLQRIHSHNIPRLLRDRQRQYHNKPRRKSTQPARFHLSSTRQERSNSRSHAFQRNGDRSKEYSGTVRHRPCTLNISRRIRTSNRKLRVPRHRRTGKLLPCHYLGAGQLPWSRRPRRRILAEQRREYPI